MAALSVELSPPFSNTPYQALKPHEYLQSSTIALTVKRKSGLSVTTPLRKNMRFDIEPICQDANMDSYQARINRAIGYPKKTRVMLPMEYIGTMQNTLKVLEEGHEQRCKTIEGLKIQITELNTQNMEQDIRMMDLEKLNHQRLSLMRTNILLDFVKKMCPKTHVPSSSSQSPLGHESTRLALDAASIDKKKLLFTSHVLNHRLFHYWENCYASRFYLLKTRHDAIRIFLERIVWCRYHHDQV